jgi:hypothetical protein
MRHYRRTHLRDGPDLFRRTTVFAILEQLERFDWSGALARTARQAWT